MKLTAYQERARSTAVYPRPKPDVMDPYEARRAMEFVPIAYCTLGLAGEAGEVAEQVKKSWRNNMEITDDRKAKIADEMGDVLWYLANLACELDLDLGLIASKNLDKLRKRLVDDELKKG